MGSLPTGRGSIGMGVMCKAVLGVPPHLVDGPSGHLLGRVIGEGNESIYVQSMDSVTRLLQQEPAHFPDVELVSVRARRASRDGVLAAVYPRSYSAGETKQNSP